MAFVQLILSEEEESLDKVLPFITEETLQKPILMKEEDEKVYNLFPLYLATTSSKWSLLPKMIERGADVNKLAVFESGYTESCLSQATSQGAVESVKLLLHHGAKVNHGNALSGAVEIRNEELVRILLEAGEDPNRPDKHGETPLFKAIREENEEMKEILLGAGADLRFAKFCNGHKEKEKEQKIEEERLRKEEEKRAEEEERIQKEKEEQRKKTEPRTITARSMTPELKEVLFYSNKLLLYFLECY